MQAQEATAGIYSRSSPFPRFKRLFLVVCADQHWRRNLEELVSR
jgi:hypothetical protein